MTLKIMQKKGQLRGRRKRTGQSQYERSKTADEMWSPTESFSLVKQIKSTSISSNDLISVIKRCGCEVSRHHADEMHARWKMCAIWDRT